MVPQATANGHLETMETDKDQIYQSDKTWCKEIEGVGMVKYKEKLLAYSGQLYLKYHHNQREVATSRLCILY